jgi:hypothetical protein
MDLLTIAKKIADRVEAESLKQTYRMRLGDTAPGMPLASIAVLSCT